jgi:hypothetical protein
VNNGQLGINHWKGVTSQWSAGMLIALRELHNAEKIPVGVL